MSGAEEFIALIESMGRRVFVTDDLIDLGKLDQPNEIYVLQMLSASTAAGGRGAGRVTGASSRSTTSRAAKGSARR
jgi:hypothetical protein